MRSTDTPDPALGFPLSVTDSPEEEEENKVVALYYTSTVASVYLICGQNGSAI